MMIFNYKSKKEMKTFIGQPLDYTETSMFGAEFKPDGQFAGCNRPFSPEFPKFEQRKGREFFATVTMQGSLIKSVS